MSAEHMKLITCVAEFFMCRNKDKNINKSQKGNVNFLLFSAVLSLFTVLKCFLELNNSLLIGYFHGLKMSHNHYELMTLITINIQFGCLQIVTMVHYHHYFEISCNFWR